MVPIFPYTLLRIHFLFRLCVHCTKSLTTIHPSQLHAINDTSNYQKQIANRNSRVYYQNRASQSLGQLGLQYSHIESEKARKIAKQQEAERKEREEQALKEREKQMQILKKEARKEVLRETNFEINQMKVEEGRKGKGSNRMSVVVEEEEGAAAAAHAAHAAPISMARSLKWLGGFWGRKGRE